MTVFKDTRSLAEAAVMLADALLQGKTPQIPGARMDDTSYDTGVKTVQAYLLEPVNVTADNYYEIMIESGYYSEEQLQ
jgi:putative multiple sugar transport system substrate-binding protein